jgi:hypothetical protein
LSDIEIESSLTSILLGGIVAALRAVIVLPWEVYLNLYTRLLFLASKQHERSVAQILVAGLIAITQLFVIWSIPQLYREVVLFGKAGAVGLMVFLIGMNSLIFCSRYGEAFELRLASMPVAKRWLLNVFAAAWVIFAFVVGYRSLYG